MKRLLTLVLVVLTLTVTSAGIVGAQRGGDDMRVASGNRNTLSFPAGTPVFGSEITLDNNTLYRACYFKSAPVSGKVRDGAIYPWAAEIVGIPDCTTGVPVPEQPSYGNGRFTRSATGVGNTLRFFPTTPVLGVEIKLDNGKVYRECYLENPPTGGSVTTGAIWPWSGEIASVKACK